MIFIVGAAVLAGMITFYLFLLAPAQTSSSSHELWEVHYAHRGLYHKDQSIPENSLAAFAEAANAGYGIEMDLTITADDQIVVFHDDTLARACGVQQIIWDCTYDKIRSYRLFGTDEGIPLFSESLALVMGRVPLIVEFKKNRRYRMLCAKAAELLDDYKGLYCIESFDPRIVRWFMKNRPHVVRGQLSAGTKSYEATPFYKALLMSALLCNVATRPHFVAYCHQDARSKLGLKTYRFLGGKLVAWTVQNAESMEKHQRLFHAMIFEFFRP